MAHTNNKFARPTFEAPPPAPNVEVGKPVDSGPAPVAPPEPPPPIVTPPVIPVAPPPVQEVVKPKPPPPVQEVVKPKPPPPPRPRNYSPIDSQEAGPVGDYAQADVPSGVDASTLTSTTVTVSYEIDEDGHASSVRVTKGSGNADVDDACKEAIRRTRFKPAIQDHLKLRQPASYTFTVG